MLYKNILASEINKFKSEYIKINSCDFLKCDYKKIDGNKKCIVWNLVAHLVVLGATK